MKARTGIIVPAIVVTLLILTIVALPLNAGADEIRIDSIGDKDIGREVTVSGVIIAFASNIEPSKEVDKYSQTIEPGETGVITIDDGTDSIFVITDPRRLEAFYKGQRVMVTGIYAGTDIIYADTVSTDVRAIYRNVTVKELTGFPQYYYAQSVRIQGNVTRIAFTQDETELTVKDQTGTMKVDYRAWLEDITVGDEVIVEGKFYRNKIYAFAVRAPVSEPEVTPEPSPSPTPTPTPAPAPTPVPTTTSSPTPTEEEESLPLYLLVAIIAIVAIAGVILFFRVRDWLMIRRYGK